MKEEWWFTREDGSDRLGKAGQLDESVKLSYQGRNGDIR